MSAFDALPFEIRPSPFDLPGNPTHSAPASLQNSDQGNLSLPGPRLPNRVLAVCLSLKSAIQVPRRWSVGVGAGPALLLQPRKNTLPPRTSALSTVSVPQTPASLGTSVWLRQTGSQRVHPTNNTHHNTSGKSLRLSRHQHPASPVASTATTRHLLDCTPRLNCRLPSSPSSPCPSPSLPRWSPRSSPPRPAATLDKPRLPPQPSKRRLGTPPPLPRSLGPRLRRP